MLSLNFQFKWKILKFKKKKTSQFVYHYTCFFSFRLMYCWGNRQSNRLSRIQIYVYLVHYRTLIVIHIMNAEWVCYIMRRTIFNVYICLNHSWWCKHRAYFRHLLRVVTACNACRFLLLFLVHDQIPFSWLSSGDKTYYWFLKTSGYLLSGRVW